MTRSDTTDREEPGETFVAHVHGCRLSPDHKGACLSDTPHRFGPDGCEHCDVADSRERDERREKYSVAEIREAYALFASKDDWGVPAFYDTGLIAALRGEYDDEDTNRKRMILRLGGTL